jgi:hypothetical protein
MRHTKLTIFLLPVIFFLIGCGPPLREDEIRAKIDSTIPVGTSKKDVIQFLQVNSFSLIVDPKGIRPPNNIEYEWITASLEQKVLWREHYTVVDFFFDQQNDSLMEYRIRSFYAGPGT